MGGGSRGSAIVADAGRSRVTGRKDEAGGYTAYFLLLSFG
ncbi:hypothetical protein SAMN05444972_10768 [Marininema halotolerans]|uniref:Uncharacterized protein n=1 Tax=Marininema halotolerans TaxID=1155944 RepID=A0A1I6SGG7_9BACL|nr:hypothetical protein SAMN05444972_10768 [Marininema halotolerans]